MIEIKGLNVNIDKELKELLQMKPEEKIEYKLLKTLINDNLLHDTFSSIDKETLCELDKIIDKNGITSCQWSLIVPLQFYLMDRLSERGMKQDKVMDMIVSLFIFYGIYENFVGNLIIKYEGNRCSSDKVSYILRCIYRYLRYNENFELKQEGVYVNRNGVTVYVRCYWEPKFGTIEDWIEYFKSIYELIDGHLEKYNNIHKKLSELGRILRDNSNNEKITYREYKDNIYLKDWNEVFEGNDIY